MKVKITHINYQVKPEAKKNSSGKVTTTVTIQQKIKTKIVHI